MWRINILQVHKLFFMRKYFIPTNYHNINHPKKVRFTRMESKVLISTNFQTFQKLVSHPHNQSIKIVYDRSQHIG